MLTFKQLTFEELKRDYIERRGFVFVGATPSSDAGIETLCNTLIGKVTKELPEFVVRFGDMTFVCVYANEFDCATFYQRSQLAARMGICAVDTLYNFLTNN